MEELLVSLPSQCRKMMLDTSRTAYLLTRREEETESKILPSTIVLEVHLLHIGRGDSKSGREKQPRSTPNTGREALCTPRAPLVLCTSRRARRSSVSWCEPMSVRFATADIHHWRLLWRTIASGRCESANSMSTHECDTPWSLWSAKFFTFSGNYESVVWCDFSKEIHGVHFDLSEVVNCFAKFWRLLDCDTYCGQSFDTFDAQF